MNIDRRAFENFAGQLVLCTAGNDARTMDDLRNYMTAWCNGAERCESPIEQYMLTSLMFLDVPGIDGPHSINEDPHAETGCKWRCVIYPQMWLDHDVRVDFYLELYGDNDDAKALIVIECDGHEFHEKTKEQAQRDKSRDRRIQAWGNPVFRYTGSEIYRNPLSCTKDLAEYLSNIVAEKSLAGAA